MCCLTALSMRQFISACQDMVVASAKPFSSASRASMIEMWTLEPPSMVAHLPSVPFAGRSFTPFMCSGLVITFFE